MLPLRTGSRPVAAACRRAAGRPRRRVLGLLAAAVGVLLIGMVSGGVQPAPEPVAAPAASTAVAPAAAPGQECDPVQDWDCIPEPEPPAEFGPPEQEETEEPDEGDDGPGGIAGWIFEGITAAINGFFSTLASAALDPLLDMLGNTLLTTPTPDELPQVNELWSTSWYITLASYSVLVMVAGLVVMGHQTLQTQYNAREMAPRIVVGFLASFLSLWVGTRMIVIANGLTDAVMSSEVATEGAANVLAGMVITALSSGRLAVFLGLAVAVFLVAILVAYVVRVSLIVIMLAGAPLALACHALPQTEGIAKWWWKTFAALLSIQVAQSLTLVTALNVFLGPDSFALFGAGDAGLISLTTTLGLMYILWKIPSWILSTTRIGGGRRSLIGSMARAYLTYKTFGMLRGAAAGATATRAAGTRGVATPRGPGAMGRPWRGRGPAPGAPAGRNAAPGLPPRPSAPVRHYLGPQPFLAPGPTQPTQPTPPPRRHAGPPPPPRPGFRAPGQPDPAAPAALPTPHGPPGMPVFRPPTPGSPSPGPAGTARGPAPAATFRAPGQSATATSPPRMPRPSGPPARPTFQAPPPPPAARRPPPQGTAMPTFRPPSSSP